MSTVLSGARDVRITGHLKCPTPCPPPVVTVHPVALASILDGALVSSIEDVKCEIATDARVILADLAAKVSVGDAKKEDLALIEAKAARLQHQLDAAGILCPFKPIVIKL